ncbi:hypothetical protein AALC17_18225 [Oscillospiraceae bacterium 38-13]
MHWTSPQRADDLPARQGEHQPRPPPGDTPFPLSGEKPPIPLWEPIIPHPLDSTAPMGYTTL